jgi:hypothetical protein
MEVMHTNFRQPDTKPTEVGHRNFREPGSMQSLEGSLHRKIEKNRNADRVGCLHHQ